MPVEQGINRTAVEISAKNCEKTHSQRIAAREKRLTARSVWSDLSGAKIVWCSRSSFTQGAQDIVLFSEKWQMLADLLYFLDILGFSAPQVYLNYNGQNLVRSANIGVVSANRKRKFDSGEVITIDSSEESDCDNNNAPPSRRKTPSPPPLQIADAFSLSGAPTGRNSPPDLDSSLEAIQGSLLDDFVTSSQKDPISRNSKRDMNKNSEKVVSPNKSRKTVPSCDLCGKSFDRSERYVMPLGPFNRTALFASTVQKWYKAKGSSPIEKQKEAAYFESSLLQWCLLHANF